MPVLRSQVLRGRGGEATPKQENKQKMLQEHRNNPDEVVEPIATRTRRRRAAAGAALDKELKAGNERVVVGVGVGGAVVVGTVKEEEEEEEKRSRWMCLIVVAKVMISHLLLAERMTEPLLRYPTRLFFVSEFNFFF
ncbi:hypothetical protein NC652_008298 [Populus alba x Populus x berolinensis]|nr:hypothetical protein NC652_008298 [Populus alba x Populus x berolinensis]